ncbi:MAG: hypothetical protein HFI25_09495, partial [Lachnospiraceae bacterium]|nr:hypothetical protein [Lachnospiraceae bacterium]
MKRFYLFCNAGMSTSLLASKMQKTADAHELPIEIKAFSDTHMSDVVNEFNPEVILLGPQPLRLLSFSLSGEMKFGLCAKIPCHFPFFILPI